MSQYDEQVDPPSVDDLCDACERGETCTDDPRHCCAVAPPALAIPTLKEVWDLDGRIAAVTEEMHEAERQAAAPYRDALELLQAKREALFDAAIAADAPPEVHPFGTLRIEVPTRRTPRTIDDAAFVRQFPQHLARCASVKIRVGEAEKVLSADDFATVVIPGEIVYGDPVLKLVAPPAPKVMAGTAPKRKKSEILRERSEP